MRKHMFLLWAVYGALLMIMFFISSTDILIVHEKNEVRSIAVIMNHDRDDEYLNLKKGIERACTDYNVDLDFIRLDAGGGSAEQIDIVLREAREGADALIVPAVDQGQLFKAAEGGRHRPPLVLLGGTKDVLLPTLVVSLEEGLRGFREAIEGREMPQKAYLLTSRQTLRQIEGVQEEVGKLLGNAGMEVSVQKGKLEAEDLEAFLAGGESPMLIALDKESFSDIAMLLSEKSELRGRFSGIYGVGATVYLLNKLEQGLIDGMIIWNEYEEGYAAVELALRAINEEGYVEKKSIESFYIDRSVLLSEEFTGMLYPID